MPSPSRFFTRIWQTTRMVAERFRDEAVTLDRLSHDHVVRFYSFEQSGELAFLVMEYVEGSTISDRLPIQDLAEIQRLSVQICSALSYAHKLGYLHRDIKPGNILVTADGKAKVSDFGIAKIMGSVTMTSGYIGTQYYMSPEQCRLEKLDQRSDIYAFGVMLYEMATGIRPFRGDRVDPTTDTTSPILWEQLHLPPVPPSQVKPDIHPQLEAIILKCLEKEPSNRFQDFNQISQAIQSISTKIDQTFIEDRTFVLPIPPPYGVKPVQAKPPGPVVRPIEPDEIKIIPNRTNFIRRKFFLPIALLAAAFLVITVFGIFFIYRMISNQAAEPPGQADPVFQTATALALALRELSSTQQAATEPLLPTEPPLPTGEGRGEGSPTDLPLPSGEGGGEGLSTATLEPTSTSPPPATATSLPWYLDASRPIEILWDVAHGPRQSSQIAGGSYRPSSIFGNLANDLENQNWSIAEGSIDELPGEYDLIVVAADSFAGNAIGDAEIKNIQEFVRAGGGLIILSDINGTNNNHIKALAQAFGVSTGLIGIPVETVDVQPGDHPVMQGISDLRVLVGRRIGDQQLFGRSGSLDGWNSNDCGGQLRRRQVRRRGRRPHLRQPLVCRLYEPIIWG